MMNYQSINRLTELDGSPLTPEKRMTKTVTTSTQTSSRRRVGLIGATSTIVGFVIGASIFILPGPVAGIVGPGLPAAYVFAVIPAALTCMYLVQLGAVLPVTGSNY